MWMRLRLRLCVHERGGKKGRRLVVVAEVDGGGGKAGGEAGGKVSLVEPALVDCLAGWNGGAAHGVIEGELGHEAGIWLRGWLRLTDEGEGVIEGEGRVVADQVGD